MISPKQGSKVISLNDLSFLAAVVMVLNTCLGVLILFQELILGFFILPFIPINRIGDIICKLRKWGLPIKLPIALYLFFIVLIISLNVIGLELQYLELNENLLSNFEEFKANTFLAIKLFVVVHRFLYLLSNESSLRNTCKELKKRLKFEQNEELDDQFPAEGLDDDGLTVEKLRRELEETKQELENLRISYDKLQANLKQ